VKAGALVLACGKDPQALLDGEQRGPVAMYGLDDGDFRRVLGARRRFESQDGIPLRTDEEVWIAIATDGYCFSLPGEEQA
jgi:hypothetical protein